MKEVSVPRIRLSEFLCYAVFAVVMAYIVGFMLRTPTPPGKASVVDRSPEDAAKLKKALNLPESRAILVEFMDFQCPPCRASYPKVKAVLAKHPQVVYRPVNLPLKMHTFAFGAAVAAEVARSKGQFDSVFDDLFSGKTDLDTKSLNAYLTKRNLDPCIASPRSKPYEEAVKRDEGLAKDLKIDSTPTLLVVLPDGSVKEMRSYDLIEDAFKAF